MYRVAAVLIALCCILSAGAAALAAPAPEENVRGTSFTSPVTSLTRGESGSQLSVAANRSGLQPSIEEVQNTTNYLAADGDLVRATVHRPGLDVGTAVAADEAGLRARFDLGALDDEFRAAESDAERRAVLREFVDRIENRTERLRSRERAALAAFNAGEITTADYLSRLVEIDAAAERVASVLDQLEKFNGGQGYPVNRSRLGRIQVVLSTLRGPVRSHVGEVVSGESRPTRVLVETSDGAVTLSMIVERSGRPTYLREAFVPSAYDPSTEDPDGAAGAIERVKSLYPWAARGGISLFPGPDPAYSLASAGVYEVSLSQLHARLTVLIDAGTDQVFHEIQRKDLPAVPTGENSTNASGGLNLTVTRIKSGGAVRVHVRDNATDVPVDARVSIEGTVVGRTGPDGLLWAVAPRSAVTVTAQADGRNVTVTHSTIVIRSIDDATLRDATVGQGRTGGSRPAAFGRG